MCVCVCVCVCVHVWCAFVYNYAIFIVQMERLDTECVSVLADYQQKSFDMMSSEILEVSLVPLELISLSWGWTVSNNSSNI